MITSHSVTANTVPVNAAAVTMTTVNTSPVNVAAVTVTTVNTPPVEAATVNEAAANTVLVKASIVNIASVKAAAVTVSRVNAVAIKAVPVYATTNAVINTATDSAKANTAINAVPVKAAAVEAATGEHHQIIKIHFPYRKRVSVLLHFDKDRIICQESAFEYGIKRFQRYMKYIIVIVGVAMFITNQSKDNPPRFTPLGA